MKDKILIKGKTKSHRVILFIWTHLSWHGLTYDTGNKLKNFQFSMQFVTCSCWQTKHYERIFDALHLKSPSSHRWKMSKQYQKQKKTDRIFCGCWLLLIFDFAVNDFRKSSAKNRVRADVVY